MDIVIIAVVLVIVVIAAVRYAGSVSGKRDCCSGEVKDQGAAGAGESFAAVEVADKDESHYPYSAELTVGGMTCEHCVAAVERALDSLPGTWAQVSLAGGRARVLAKAPVDEDACRDVVERAGYRLVSFTA